MWCHVNVVQAHCGPMSRVVVLTLRVQDITSRLRQALEISGHFMGLKAGENPKQQVKCSIGGRM